MKLRSYISFAALLAVASFTACQDDLEDVENRVYDPEAYQPMSVLIDGMANEQTVSFGVDMAFPLDHESAVTYAVDASLVEAYNTIYNANAVILPAENYELTQPKAVFIAGAITSTKVEVTVTNLNDLDRNEVYVLPLTAVSSPASVIESQKIRYIVVRGAALVNVAANMAENNASLIAPSNASALNGLSELTAQFIVNIDEFGGSDSNIQTLLGIEGYFLLRISDSGVDKDQIQLATSNGNSTDASWKLKDKKWQCVTFTFNSSNGEATMFIDGVKKATCYSSFSRAVDWGSGSFYIGKSWNDNRWLNGAICEVRVWNKILSDATIAEALQPYAVASDSEGLVAYWKFNEGSGSLIHDYANGYDLQCVANPKWVEASLPEN